MAEYIEREALLLYLNDIWLSAAPTDSMIDDDRHLAMVRCIGLNDAMDAVKSIPAADVRPVVLCRDCKYYCKDADGYEMCDNSEGYDHVTEDGFCAWAVKREES